VRRSGCDSGIGLAASVRTCCGTFAGDTLGLLSTISPLPLRRQGLSDPRIHGLGRRHSMASAGSLMTILGWDEVFVRRIRGALLRREGEIALLRLVAKSMSIVDEISYGREGLMRARILKKRRPRIELISANVSAATRSRIVLRVNTHLEPGSTAVSVWVDDRSPDADYWFPAPLYSWGRCRSAGLMIGGGALFTQAQSSLRWSHR